MEVGAIVYAGLDGRLWVRWPDGEQVLVHDPGGGRVLFPEWSPDGTRIVMVESSPTTDGDGTDVVVVDLGGRELLRVPNATLPHWSPDGRSLSVAKSPRYGDLQFFITPTVIDMGTGEARQLFPEAQMYDSPRWSPDGRLLAYADLEGLFIIGSQPGSAPTRLLSGQAYDLVYLSPTWSEGGTILVFEQDKRGGRSPIGSYVAIDELGKTLSRVDDGVPTTCGREFVVRDAEGDWVESTSRAAWGMECAAGATPGLWIKEMGGSGEEYFVDVSAVADLVGTIDVSPDGRLIAFSDVARPDAESPYIYLAGSGETANIYVADIATGKIEWLVESAVYPAWQPQP